MLELSNAHLLTQSIGSLLDSPYFSKHTLDYARALHKAAQRLLEQWGSVPRPLRERIVQAMWSTHKYIAGSTSNDIPFEMEHCLARAIKHWKPRDSFLISTALLHEKEFAFVHCDPWEFILPVLRGVEAPKHTLIQISLPKLYKHSPLLCVPLFHELGHFIDTRDAITDYSFRLSQTFLTESRDLVAHDPKRATVWELNHRRELFADLFCASYMGMAGVRFLHEFAMGNPACASHPSTALRKKTMCDFLRGASSPLIELFTEVLRARGLPQLEKRFADIPLRECFADYRPAPVNDERQLFGIFTRAWSLLSASSKQGCTLWPQRTIIDRVRIANDLTEKTIRNHSIWEKWRVVAPQG
jgi:hypothetical protein